MKKIVVAESSPTIKSVADTLLRQNGYDVVCTSDGLQAWEVINSARPDLVLTGLNLSGINGLELSRQMAGDGVLGGIPVVVMIGSKDNISEDELRSSGVKGKLKKPFSPRDILTMVKRLIGEGDKTARPAQAPKSGTGTANYEADAISSRHPADNKGEAYNLDWSDLNDSGMGEKAEIHDDNPADDSENDQAIIINDDQFGLISLNQEREEDEQPKAKSSGDEDYDWFIGEMQKENSGEAGKSSPEDKSAREEESVAEQETRPHIDDEDIDFEDFQSSGEKFLIPDEAHTVKKESPEPSVEVGTQVEEKKLSDDEISRIADKVVQNLAAAIAANIDRQKILDAIKSVVNQ
jgi:CheY-like chemotaxis protein